MLEALCKVSRESRELLEATLDYEHWYDENPEAYVVGMLYIFMRDSVKLMELVRDNPDTDISELCELIGYALPDIEDFHDIGSEFQYIDKEKLERFIHAFRNLQFLNMLKGA